MCPEAGGRKVPAYLGREGSTLQWEEVVKKKRKSWTRSSRRNRGGDDITNWTEIKYENQKIKMNQMQISE